MRGKYLTTYLRSARIYDGYAGGTRDVHLCRCPVEGITYAVWSGGYLLWADPNFAIQPLPEVPDDTLEAR